MIGSDPREAFAERVRSLASQFQYPPTPALSARLGRARRGPVRPLRWALAGIVLVLAGLLAVPSVRAAVVEVLPVGAVRLFFGGPTPTPPRPTGQLRISDLPGETTLAEAAARVPFAIRLPRYPPDLGPPDRVFLLRDFGGILILIWENPAYADTARLVLSAIPPGPIVNKLFPEQVASATVSGRPAIWTSGDHFVETLLDGRSTLALVRGHVLIWTAEEITYRLETDLPLSEAVRVAESLAAFPAPQPAASGTPPSP